uniref:Uncharacterized protein n=1 Tax=Anguilla anguilla TaxID=7936 RepID=A0A0E9R369_ANGAN
MRFAGVNSIHLSLGEILLGDISHHGDLAFPDLLGVIVHSCDAMPGLVI